MAKDNLDNSLPVEQPDRRQTARFRVPEIEAQITSDLFQDSARVVNIGKLGFSARSFICYPSGKSVVLTIPGYAPMPAHVVWYGRGVVGCRFDRALEETELLSLILAEQRQLPSQTDTAPVATLRPAPAPARHRGRPASARLSSQSAQNG